MKQGFAFIRCSPEEKGLDAGTLADLRGKLNQKEIRGCLVFCKGGIVFEYYKSIDIETSRQKINSCTKSVISALIGIALNKGFIRDINVPAADYFGAYPVWADERKKRITLRHLLTMTSGLAWDESGERLFIRPGDQHEDIIGNVLGREMEAEPGTSMTYHSGCSQLLSAVIQKETGMKASAFAKEYLFQPLGITEFLWQEIQGVSTGGTGIELTHMDMLKFACLYLNGGAFNGREIIPAEWVRESTTPHVFTNNKNLGYGYHWWCGNAAGQKGEVPFYYAVGFGGQLIIVVPNYDMAVVFTGRVNKDPFLPMQLFKEHILKAVK